MNADDFVYDLPEELIASRPAPQRDQSRLMVLKNDGGLPIHEPEFHEIYDYLNKGDLLVLNDTKVIPARLFARRESGGRVELLFIQPLENHPSFWKAMAKPARRLNPGEKLTFEHDSQFYVYFVEKLEDGTVIIDSRRPENTFKVLLQEIGLMPVPPYILKRRKELNETDLEEWDNLWYQTVYARNEGSIAAPTAGLHFTSSLMNSLKKKEVQFTNVTLHVGQGTFQTMEPGRPVSAHQMHYEEIEVTNEAAQAINQAKAEGRRVICVGTTSVRTIESAAKDGFVQPVRRQTNLMIAPGYQWQVTDGLITNFHLPRSTLLLLVSAMVGWPRVKAAYEEAVKMKYRFFSYGDAMFLER